MNTVLLALREPWNIMRIFRVGFGGYIFITSLLENQLMLATIGGFFAYQGIMNVGCAACAMPTKENEFTSREESDFVEFEEVSKEESGVTKQ